MHDLPFETYKEAWSFFRSISNETSSIASHLVEKTDIQKRYRFVDLGSGNGELMKAILFNGSIAPHKVLLIDKEEKFLTITQDTFRFSPFCSKASFLKQDFTKIDLSNFWKFDAIMAIHVLYFVELDFLIKLFEELPTENTCYIVIDKPDSLFGKCWQQMNEPYYKHLVQLSDYLNDLSNDDFCVKKFEIESLIANPLLLPPREMQMVLSLLFYRDDIASPEEGASAFKNIIKSDVDQAHLALNCCGYQITRTCAQ